MREKRPLRFHAIDNSQRVFHRRMRRMWLVSQRIQKQDIQSPQLIQRRFRNLTVVGEVSRRTEPVAVNLSFAVNQNHRLEACPEYLDRPIDRTQFQLSESAEFVIRIEDVREHSAQKSCRVWPRIKRQLVGLVPVAQRA